MSRLISIQGYINKEFDPNGAPSAITLRKSCREGTITDYPNVVGAKKIGKVWYVIRDEKIQTTGNPLIDRVLCG